jgi:G:T-mismatch repair DNA endonuclease (very short patch repair protein)
VLDAKIGRNVERDQRTRRQLAEDGWNVEVLWEYEIKSKGLE